MLVFASLLLESLGIQPKGKGQNSERDMMTRMYLPILRPSLIHDTFLRAFH
jgi:hypothetical protein